MKIYNEKWSKRKWLEDPLNFVKYPEKAQQKGGDGVKGHLVLHVGVRLPSQDKILQTDLAKV